MGSVIAGADSVCTDQSELKSFEDERQGHRFFHMDEISIIELDASSVLLDLDRT